MLISWPIRSQLGAFEPVKHINNLKTTEANYGKVLLGRAWKDYCLLLQAFIVLLLFIVCCTLPLFDAPSVRHAI